jgi:hypothetical protein
MCSCRYRYYYLTGPKGEKYDRLREYKNPELQQRYDDKWDYRNCYRYEKYAIDSNYIAKNDSLIDCDSVKITISPESRKYSLIFTKGIFPCKILSDIYCPLHFRVYMIDSKSTNGIFDMSPQWITVKEMHILTYPKISKTKKLIKFKVYPWTYCIELTNESAYKGINMHDFIIGSHLTWFFKYPKEEI